MKGISAMQPSHTDVILHVFDWPYQKVSELADEIHRCGYKSVLVSPPMKSLKHENGTQWWQRYQPQDYRIIDNQLGDTNDFKQMIERLSALNVRTYIDVVFNHMANESSQRLDLKYPSQSDLDEYASNAEHYKSLTLFGDLSRPLFDENDFVEAFGITDWEDKWEVQNGRITGGETDPGLPTLRDSDYVIKQQQNYLIAMKELGVKGFRIDAAKHISIEHLQKVWTPEIIDHTHIFGEIITDGGATKAEYELFLKPYLSETRMGAYDFPLFQTTFDALQPKGSLKSMVNPYCFGQALSKTRAITFAVTHDIPNNDVFADLVLDEKLEQLAYSYILGRDGGVPLIYTDLDTSGIKSDDGQPRWVNAWNEPGMVARIKFHNQMHGLPMSLVEASDDLLVIKRGEEGIVALNKSKRSQTVLLESNVSFVDLLTGAVFNSIKGQVEIVVPSLNSLLLVQSGD